MTPVVVLQDYVVVPRQFVRAHPHVLDAEEVVLSDPDGIIFHVDMSIEPNEVRFEGGFATMRETYQLFGTAFIHFNLVVGTNFDVQTFHHDVVEVDYP